MVLNGTYFFDFLDEDSWRMHQLIQLGVEQKATTSLIWKALAPDDLVDGAPLTAENKVRAAHQVIADRKRQRTFREAMFVMLHKRGDAIDDPVTLRAAIKIAGLDGDTITESAERQALEVLNAIRTEAAQSDVRHPSTIMNNGPAVRVQLTGAVRTGFARSRFALIERMLTEDAIWGLSKP